jgi:hypothetical protein
MELRGSEEMETQTEFLAPDRARAFLGHGASSSFPASLPGVAMSVCPCPRFQLYHIEWEPALTSSLWWYYSAAISNDTITLEIAMPICNTPPMKPITSTIRLPHVHSKSIANQE